jgi:hypothetical protein
MGRIEDRDKRRRTGFALTPPLLAGLLFIAALTPGPLLAQAGTAIVAPRANRCLLVVETSRAMQRQSEGVLQIVRDMLRSGLSGQLRGGDTLGVWTYNDGLYAGRFPLQTWSPEAQKDITQRVLTFLKDQKYEQQASLDKVLPALSRLVKDSPLITVILISSPDEKLRRTRSEYPIHQAYENQKWREEQEKTLMPLVTIFRAQGGQLGDYTANTPQERQRAETIQAKLLEAVGNAPPTAPPPEVLSAEERQQRAETLQAKLLEAVRNAPLTNTAPVVVSGKTTQPEQAPAPKPQPAVVSVQSPIPAPEATSANKPVAVKPPAPAPQPVQIAKAEAAPVAPDKPSVDLPPKLAPAPKPVAEPNAEVVKAPEARPIVPALPAPEPKPAAPELPKPAPAPEVKPVTEPKAEVVKAPEAKPTVPALPTPETASALPNRSPEPKPTAPELPKPAPAQSTPQTGSALPAPAPEPKPAAIEKAKPAPAPEVKPAPAPKVVTEPKVEIVKAPEAKPAVPAPSKIEAAPLPPTPAPKPALAPPTAREVSTGTIPSATEAASASPRSLTLSNAPIQTATAVPAETLARNRTIWIAGLVLAGAAISLALVLLRRSRAAAGEGSLITQSFDRKHKP